MSLPIDSVLPDLAAALENGRNVVLEAPPGAGKSTRVPLALLNASWLGDAKILVLEPRRLAARAIAQRMAELLGEPVGATVGFRTRLETRTGARTRIEVVTEGILTRMLQNDAELPGIGIVIFDEFHERSLHADLGLALCLDVQGTLRDDLRLLVMSATLDGAKVAELMPSAARITSAGRAFPVTLHHRPWTQSVANRDRDIADDMAATIRRALDAHPGDLLAFLPGQGEIHRTADRLMDLPAGTRIHKLYGDLSAEDQDAALRPAPLGRRKVVLATNLAETSLTIEGVSIVVDSGWVRRLRFSPAYGMGRLERVRISRASADQRAGRAGRLGPGVCYRLWSESEHERLAAHTAPEIVEADLAPLALELACWGTHPNQLRWLDAPPVANLDQAYDLLRKLTALDDTLRATAHGREMAALGAHPRLAHMLLHANDAALLTLGTRIAATLSERDMIRGSMRNPDLRIRLEALDGGAAPAGIDVDPSAGGRVLRSADIYAQQLRKVRNVRTADRTHDDDDIAMLVGWAYPDRIARVREGNHPSGGRSLLLANGHGAWLRQPGHFANHEFLAVADLEESERDAVIHLATPITRSRIESAYADLIRTVERTEWDHSTRSVVAIAERWLDAIRLEVRPLKNPDPELILAALLAGIRETGIGALPWTEGARRLQTRMEFARRHDTHIPLPWPAVDDSTLLASLETWLAPWLDGMTRLDHLGRLDLTAILTSQLEWAQQRRLDEIAPTHIVVPSGSRIPVDYTAAGPVLAVRLQEVFGLAATPRIGGNLVPVTLHLLSPARRPVQVTRDLASFWASGYHEVKKELKGRYPKHYWPDDPHDATPTARTRPRP